MENQIIHVSYVASGNCYSRLLFSWKRNHKYNNTFCQNWLMVKPTVAYRFGPELPRIIHLTFPLGCVGLASSNDNWDKLEPYNWRDIYNCSSIILFKKKKKICCSIIIIDATILFSVPSHPTYKLDTNPSLMIFGKFM